VCDCSFVVISRGIGFAKYFNTHKCCVTVVWVSVAVLECWAVGEFVCSVQTHFWTL